MPYNLLSGAGHKLADCVGSWYTTATFVGRFVVTDISINVRYISFEIFKNFEAPVV